VCDLSVYDLDAVCNSY